MKLIFKSTLISVVIILLTGCASTLKTYQGKMLSQDETGILTCDQFLTINAVDGDKSYHIASAGGLWFRDCVVSLAPGKHTVTFRYSTGGTVSFSTGNVTHEVNVEKGKIYRINNYFEGSLWKPRIEELKGDELKEQRKRVTEKLTEK